jgi:hypothetical protein
MTIQMTTASANAGLAFQMLMDRPDLAANVRSLSINGVEGWRGHPIHFFVDGGEVELLAWREYLGPAAQTMQVQRDTQWHSNVTTKDVHVTVTHDLKAEVE